MWKSACIALACIASSGAAWSSGELTDTETRWLQLGAPALAYAREQKLPMDVVVQPQPTPGLPPLAMAFVEGRCKLVLSMRGNSEAESTLQEIEPELLTSIVEAMTAHEIGHCWRYVRGAWNTVPAGFVGQLPPPPDDEALLHAQQSRREEGFADLVGLAWTVRSHPQHYARVQAWFLNFRADPAHPGSPHDTLAWVQLANEPSAFGHDGRSLFDQAWPLWQQGLLSAE